MFDYSFGCLFSKKECKGFIASLGWRIGTWEETAFSTGGNGHPLAHIASYGSGWSNWPVFNDAGAVVGYYTSYHEGGDARITPLHGEGFGSVPANYVGMFLKVH